MPVTGNTLRMQLNDYRGLSAYEIAVQNGFEGSEKAWLESLKGEKGADGDMVTVNHKRSVDGNISVNGTDIYLYPGMQDETVTQAIEKRVRTDDIVDALDSEEADKPLSAAQGRTLAQQIAPKAQALARKALLPAEAWAETEGIYAQEAAVDGVTADAAQTSVIVSPPTDRTMEEAYLGCEVRASVQGDGVVTFTCADIPDMDLEANVMVIVSGVTGG